MTGMSERLPPWLQQLCLYVDLFQTWLNSAKADPLKWKQTKINRAFSLEIALVI